MKVGGVSVYGLIKLYLPVQCSQTISVTVSTIICTVNKNA